MTQEAIIKLYSMTPQEQYDALPDALRAYATPPTASTLSVADSKREWSRGDMILRGLQGDNPAVWADIDG